MSCTVSVVREYREIENLRPLWEQLQKHPNSDLDHYLLVCKTRKEVFSPFVAVVSNEGQPRCLVAGRVEKTVFKPQFGYLSPVGIPAKAISTIYQGVMGELSPECAAALVQMFKETVRNGDADYCVFRQLPEDSLLLEALHSSVSRSALVTPRERPAHWSLRLKPEPGFLVKNMRSKHRSWIKKKINELEAKHPNAVSWEWKTEFNDLIEFCDAIEQVAALSYQRGLGAGFFNNDEHRSRYALFARRGMLRACILRAEGRPVGFWIGTIYKGVFHSSVTGFNSIYRDIEVGTQIFLQTVDNLVKEGVGEFDFGLGDASYKQRFGDRSWKESTLHLFAPSLKGRTLRGITGFFDFADHNARRALLALGALQKVKTKWRRLVEKRDSTEPTNVSKAVDNSIESSKADSRKDADKKAQGADRNDKTE